MPHGKHMFQTASYMAIATMCVYSSSKYALPHWKCFLHCCAKCPRIYLPSQESDPQNLNFIPTIRFHIYQYIAHLILHGRLPFNEKEQCQLCESSTYVIVAGKKYIIK